MRVYRKQKSIGLLNLNTKFGLERGVLLLICFSTFSLIQFKINLREFYSFLFPSKN